MKNEREKSGMTSLIYEVDAYRNNITARVLVCEPDEEKNMYGIILDQTIFFPEGGGQGSDQGLIDGHEVWDVQTVNGEVVHYLKAPLEINKEVLLSLDWEKRFRKMQNHSGEHLFCGVIHNLFGYDNVGFHMNEEEVTLDVNGPLTKEELQRVEELANDYIYQNLAITVSFPDEKEAGELEYRSKLELTKGIRLVTIAGVDVCACCAPHVEKTSEIGLIHVVDFMPHRGGCRITLVCGKAAYTDYVRVCENNEMVGRLFSAKRYETGKMADNFSQKCQKLQKELSEYKSIVTEMMISKAREQIENRVKKDGTPELILVEGLDMNQLRNLINECKEGKEYALAGFTGNDEKGYDYIISGGSESLPELAKKINTALNGRGGGNMQMVQGHVSSKKQEIKKYFT